MNRFIAFLIRCVVLSGSLTLACGGTPTSPRPRTIVAALAITVGDGQTDTVAHTLPVAVTVQAKDALGSVASSVVLNWYETTNEGVNCVGCSDTIFVGAALTDASGGAAFRWTLRTRAGPQGLIAEAIGPDGDRIVHTKATATAVPDQAASMMTSQAQVAPGGFVLASQHAWANDRYGNAVPTPPSFGSLPAGWTVRGDTAIASNTPGRYTLPVKVDRVQTSFVAVVQ